MKLDGIYDFFLLPLSNRHTLGMKVLSSLTVLAITILTAGIYLLPLGIAYWKDRRVVVLTPQSGNAPATAAPVPPNTPTSPVGATQAKVEQVTKIITPTLTHTTKKIDEIKSKHHDQLQQFEEYAKNKDWKRFDPEYSHYDWWMFPIKRESSYGKKYSVDDAEIQMLKNDADFMRKYRRGVELVLNSWGWDPIQNQEIPVGQRTPDQRWKGYGVRLGKMADSLYLFGEKELYKSVQNFANICCTRGGVAPLDGWVIQNLTRVI